MKNHINRFKKISFFFFLQKLWPTPLQSTHTPTQLTRTRTRTRPHTQLLTPLTRATLTLTMMANTGQANTKRLTTQLSQLTSPPTRFTTTEHPFPTTPLRFSGNKRSF